MKNKILKYGISAIIWIVFTLPALAGPVDPPGGEDPPYVDPTPLDNWAILLVFAGIILGIYFVKKYRNMAMKS